MSMSDGSFNLVVPPDSPGSSVSTRLQEEYDELLKYAVVMPTFNGAATTSTTNPFTQQFAGIFSSGANENTHSVAENSTVSEPSLAENQSTANLQPGSEVTTRPPLNDTDESVPRPGLLRDLTALLPAAPSGDDVDSCLTCTTSRATTARDGDVLEEEESHVSASIDCDVARMSELLDRWTAELKRNVLAEFSQAKIRLLEDHKRQLMREKQLHNAASNEMLSDTAGLRELLHTYEQSISRKDTIIGNLTRGVQHAKEKHDMLRSMCSWKINHSDCRRETFATKLATRHYECSLKRRCWDSWHAIVEDRWRNRVEKACQAKAQQVCMSLTDDYETKIASLNEALTAARNEVNRLHEERDRYEETMKKAFMRGVCALNLEAMSMFHGNDEGKCTENGINGGGGGGDVGGGDADNITTGHVHWDSHRPVSTEQGDGPAWSSHEPVQHTSEPAVVPPRVVNGQRRDTKTKSSTGSRTISAKVSCRPDTHGPASGLATLAPPMGSVVVERHHAVTKKTIGQATASRYPVVERSAAVPRRLAGQSATPVINPGLHTVRSIE